LEIHSPSIVLPGCSPARLGVMSPALNHNPHPARRPYLVPHLTFTPTSRRSNVTLPSIPFSARVIPSPPDQLSFFSLPNRPHHNCVPGSIWVSSPLSLPLKPTTRISHSTSRSRPIPSHLSLSDLPLQFISLTDLTSLSALTPLALALSLRSRTRANKQTHSTTRRKP
jgi:hypothetical protein